MNRRELLKLLALGVVSHTLDIDKLLWIPDQKTIFIPSKAQINYYSQIVEMELQKMLPKIKDLFERDDHLYAILSSGSKSSIF